MLIVGVSVGLRHEPGCYGVMEVEKGEGLGLGHHGHHGNHGNHGNQGQGQGQGQEGPTIKKGKAKGNKGMGNDSGHGQAQGYVGFHMLLHPLKRDKDKGVGKGKAGAGAGAREMARGARVWARARAGVRWL
jgi:hypothetical protein